VIFLNGFNLGVYWPVFGPQVSLYIPGNLVKAGEVNTLMIVELMNLTTKASERKINFTAEPIQ